MQECQALRWTFNMLNILDDLGLTDVPAPSNMKLPARVKKTERTIDVSTRYSSSMFALRVLCPAEPLITKFPEGTYGIWLDNNNTPHIQRRLNTVSNGVLFEGAIQFPPLEYAEIKFVSFGAAYNSARPAKFGVVTREEMIAYLTSFPEKTFDVERAFYTGNMKSFVEKLDRSVASVDPDLPPPPPIIPPGAPMNLEPLPTSRPLPLPPTPISSLNPGVLSLNNEQASRSTFPGGGDDIGDFSSFVLPTVRRAPSLEPETSDAIPDLPISQAEDDFVFEPLDPAESGEALPPPEMRGNLELATQDGIIDLMEAGIGPFVYSEAEEEAREQMAQNMFYSLVPPLPQEASSTSTTTSTSVPPAQRRALLDRESPFITVDLDSQMQVSQDIDGIDFDFL